MLPARPARVWRQRWELSPENPRDFSACPRCFPPSTRICPLAVGSFSRGAHSFGPLKDFDPYQCIAAGASVISWYELQALERTEESQE